MAAAAAQQQPDLEAAGGRPSLKRGVSMTGKLAQFADADAEVERILKNQKVGGLGGLAGAATPRCSRLSTG